MKNLLLTLIFSFQLLNSNSQRTGTYDTSFSILNSPFNSEIRKFSVKVNQSYSSNNKYPLVIGLHGMGEVSNYNIDDNGFLVDSIGAILVCPDGMDASQSRHDNQYSGNEVSIIQEAIDFAKRNYNIDTNSIYLMGFSYGARVSLYYGLSQKNIFRGIIGISTAFQSINDANNNLAMPWSKPFNYTNGREIPTCLCIGTADATFYPFVKKGYQNMIDSGAKVLLIEITGVGHTPAYPNYNNDVMNCIQFINQNKNSYPPIADFKDYKISNNKDSIIATNTSTGNISKYQWYIKKNNIKTDIDTGSGLNHNLKFKLNTINSFDSLCLEVSNLSGQKNIKCKLLKLSTTTLSDSKEESIHLYPNPTTGKFSISFYNYNNENISVSITDITGRMILNSNEINLQHSHNNIVIDLSNKVKKGVYNIQVTTANSSFSKQIVIE